MEDNGLSSVLAVLGVFAIIFVLFFVALVILLIVAEWKMYQKAGKKGWESIVPFYNRWVYVDIAGLNWWWFFVVIAGSLLSFSSTSSDGTTISFNLGSIITLFGMFVCNYNIAKKLHRETGFAVLMTIFPVIMYPIIAFSNNYQFDNNVVLSKNGPFPDNGSSTSTNTTTTTNTNSEDSSKEDANTKFCPYCGEKLNKDTKFCSKCGKEV